MTGRMSAHRFLSNSGVFDRINRMGLVLKKFRIQESSTGILPVSAARQAVRDHGLEAHTTF